MNDKIPHIAIIFYLTLILSPYLYSQAEYVETENSIYEFLERMEAYNYIHNYNSFKLPKTRNEIAGYLKDVINNDADLNSVDKGLLAKFKVEYEYELFGTLRESQKLIDGCKYNFLSEKERYLYYNVNSFSTLFINIIGQAEYIFRDDNFQSPNNASLGLIGGIIRGTVWDKFGFVLSGTNGYISGNRQAALIKKDLQYNYKISIERKNFFDDTYGSASADFKILKFKLGRDRLKIGYGAASSLIDANSPMLDYLGIDLNYGIFEYSFFHGKLLGSASFREEQQYSGGSTYIKEKYLGYHRIGFNISKHFNFGLGEFVVYGDRPLDISYLNPFVFYKSVEHSNMDRDNSMLFLDINNKSLRGVKLHSLLLIDDIDYGKLGTAWWGNQTSLSFGALFSCILDFPVDVKLEYMRISPYTFSHRLLRNNFTNLNYTLGSFTQPNSGLFFSQINYRFTSEMNIWMNFTYNVHGANPIDSEGNIKENIGGDINFGHRVIDSDNSEYLSGVLEYRRNLQAGFVYEPFNQIWLHFTISYENANLQSIKSHKELYGFFTLMLRI